MNNQKSMDVLERSSLALERERKTAEVAHEHFRNEGLLQGAFHDSEWFFNGRKMNFSLFDCQGSDAIGFLGKVARCYLIDAMKSGLKSGSAANRLGCLKPLVKKLGLESRSWICMNSTILNDVVREIKAGSPETTTYNRATSIKLFVDYANRVVHKVDGKRVSLLSTRVRWHHGIKNPIRSMIQVASPKAERSDRSKYQVDLHLALGAARSHFRKSDCEEPRPGYDLVRLEALTFAMALGLRIGEICSLQTTALDTEATTQTMFLRVFTEKGSLPAARPIPQIWAPIVADAFDYLLNHCIGPRARAREIEENGFQYLSEGLNNYRKDVPLTPQRVAQLRAIDLDSNAHYFIDEFEAAFGTSAKEFTSGGRYDECSVPLPKSSAAQVVVWLDQRFANWDWSVFAEDRCDKRTGQEGGRSISIPLLANHCGVPKSPLDKGHWYIDDLRQFLVELSRSGAFKSVSGDRPANISAIETLWKTLRSQMLSNRGDRFMAVSLCTLVEVLERKYRRYLEVHFEECLELEAGSVESVPNKKRDNELPKLSENLVVIWENQFSSTRAGRALLPKPIMPSDFYHYLCKNAQKTTVFERLDIRDQKGNVYSITTHQIRHWVTTALLRSGPSEAMIDLWMGREVGQSRHYDHRTSTERAEVARKRYTAKIVPDDFLGRKVATWRKQNISEGEISQMIQSKMRVFHFSPWGGCSRELSVSPCDRAVMCLRGFGTDSACPSFHIDPSDELAKREIIELKEKYARQIRALDPELADLKRDFLFEMNTHESLDQHIRFMLDIVRGCDEALRAYERGESGDTPGQKTIAIRVSKT